MAATIPPGTHSRVSPDALRSVDFASLDAAVSEALAQAQLTAQARDGAGSAWRDTAARLAYLPVDYSAAMIDYQLAYWSGDGVPVRDLSLLLLHDRQPCGVWPLSATFATATGWRIGSNGSAVLPPLFVAGMARKSVKSMTAECLAFLDATCGRIGQPGFESVEAYAGAQGLSDWHDRLMQDGAVAQLRHDLFLDISRPMAEIRSGFRKSYRALITSGSKLWKTQVVTAADPAQWDEFRLLHLAVAGRQTRSAESWRLQHEAIASGDAFFVCLRDSDAGRMVGGGLFHVTRDEGLYAVGAYDRTLFDEPLGHVVQFHAIEEMKRRGIRWYKLGARAYPSDIPAPGEKEMTISNFKRGFSSHCLPRYLVKADSNHD
ncbi:MAG TPA: FemAB family protein [Xanthomonadaceae bacterium]|jgi:FemAB family protein